jgi:hypothetical protein
MALVMSLNESVYQALPGLGILLGGVAAQLDGPRIAFVVAGVGSLVIAVTVTLLLRQSLGPVDAGPVADGVAVGPLTFAAQRETVSQ